MQRRSVDEIERKIAQWERTRECLGADAVHAMVSFINGEIDRLRFEKMVRDRPMPNGRRATDKLRRPTMINPVVR